MISGQSRCCEALITSSFFEVHRRKNLSMSREAKLKQIWHNVKLISLSTVFSRVAINKSLTEPRPTPTPPNRGNKNEVLSMLLSARLQWNCWLLLRSQNAQGYWFSKDRASCGANHNFVDFSAGFATGLELTAKTHRDNVLLGVGEEYPLDSRQYIRMTRIPWWPRGSREA